jgi:hypothetical protein
MEFINTIHPAWMEVRHVLDHPLARDGEGIRERLEKRGVTVEWSADGSVRAAVSSDLLAKEKFMHWLASTHEPGNRLVTTGEYHHVVHPNFTPGNPEGNNLHVISHGDPHNPEYKLFLSRHKHAAPLTEHPPEQLSIRFVDGHALFTVHGVESETELEWGKREKLQARLDVLKKIAFHLFRYPTLHELGGSVLPDDFDSRSDAERQADAKAANEE